jgi:hypothetical protein
VSEGVLGVGAPMLAAFGVGQIRGGDAAQRPTAVGDDNQQTFAPVRPSEEPGGPGRAATIPFGMMI